MNNKILFFFLLLLSNMAISQNCVNMYDFDDTSCSHFATATPVDPTTLSGDCLQTYTNAIAVKNAMNACPTLNVNFTTINIDCGTYYGAYSGITCNTNVNNGSQIDIIAHLQVGTGFGQVDIIAHELGHAYLQNYLDYSATSSFETRSLHEGLSDAIGIYIESKIEGPTDWIIGEGTSIVRNLSTPTCYPLFNNIFTNTHTAGATIGYFYKLLTDIFGMDTAMEIYIAAVQSLDSDDVFVDFISAVLSEVTTNHPNDIDATLIAINEISCITYVCTGNGDEACAEFKNTTSTTTGWTFSPQCIAADGETITVTATNGANSTQMLVTLPDCEDYCPNNVEAPTVEIRCNDAAGMACLFVNGQWFHNQSATYMYCPSNVSCFDYSQAGDTVYYTFCEWGTGSNCTTGEGCCWDYELIIPDCTADCVEPTLTLECDGNLACLHVNGLAVPNHIWGTVLPTCVNTNTATTMNYNVFLINNPSCSDNGTLDLPECGNGGGGAESVTVAGLSSEKPRLTKESINVFPNPALHYLTITLDESYDCQFELVELSGVVVKSGLIRSSKEVINIADLSNGMYFLRIKEMNPTGHTVQQKVLKF